MILKRLKKQIKKSYSRYLLRGAMKASVQTDSGCAANPVRGRGRRGPKLPSFVYLVDQTAGPEGRYRYGITRTANTGCEIIAVYNLLLKYGKQKSYGALIRRLDKRGGGRVLFGLFGTNIRGMREELYRSGIATKCIPGSRLEEMDRAQAGILSFWWSESSMYIHTVMIEKSRGGRWITAYNYKPWNGIRRISAHSVSELIKNQGICPIVFLEVQTSCEGRGPAGKADTCGAADVPLQ